MSENGVKEDVPQGEGVKEEVGSEVKEDISRHGGDDGLPTFSSEEQVS